MQRPDESIFLVEKGVFLEERSQSKKSFKKGFERRDEVEGLQSVHARQCMCMYVYEPIPE